MATKPSMVVPYNEELPSIKLHDSWITRSSDFDFSYIRFAGLERKSHHQFMLRC